MKRKRTNWISVLACVGWSAGMLLGAAFRNPALWSLTGMAAGAALGIVLTRKGA